MSRKKKFIYDLFQLLLKKRIDDKNFEGKKFSLSLYSNLIKMPLAVRYNQTRKSLFVCLLFFFFTSNNVKLAQPTVNLSMIISKTNLAGVKKLFLITRFCHFAGDFLNTYFGVFVN